MSNTLTVNSIGYSFPASNETGWGSAVSSWASAVSTTTLQKSGGAFTLTADANFGGSFGLVSSYFTSRTSNASTAGAVRLARADTVGWRNHANGANLLLGPGSDNLIEFNSVDLVDVSTAQTLTNKTLTAPTITASPSVSPAMFAFHGNAVSTVAGTYYFRPYHYSTTLNTTEIQTRLPFACKVSNMYVNVSAAGTGSGTHTYTLRKNGVDSAVTCSHLATATTAEDTTHSETFAAGEKISLKVVVSSNVTGALGEIIITLMLTQA